MPPEAIGDRPGREEQFDEILAEYFQMAEAGLPPGEQDFVLRHPGFAEELKEFFADKKRFDLVAESLSPSRPASQGSGVDGLDRPPRAGPADTAPLVAASPSTPPPGRCLGDYELLEEVACGGMGIVYRARQRGLNRIVAVKMILSAQLASRTDVERFRREAQAAANLRHRNIVKIHEVDEQDGLHFFSMDFIEGKSLAAMVREGPLPAEQAARYVKKVAEAIHYAHQQGILHRDLKPANVLVDQDDEPVVTDFGLAKRMKADSQLTGSGGVLGTPSYMSPEQASGRAEIGPASDVYGLGAVLYELLTGRPPFRGETPTDTLLDVLTAQPSAPRMLNREVAGDLETISLKCLEKEPTRRYPTAAALAEDLGRFLEGEPIRAKPVGLLRRSWHWIRGIPLVAALTGRTLTRPTVWQKRVQWAINLASLLLVVAIAVWVFKPPSSPRPWPQTPQVLSGPDGWTYHAIAKQLERWLEDSHPVKVESTRGSEDNADRLSAGTGEIALIQFGLCPNDCEVVAELYRAVIYVVVRRGEKAALELRDFKGKTFSLPPSGTGMRDAARMLLTCYGINECGSDSKDDRPETLLNRLCRGDVEGAILILGPVGPREEFWKQLLRGEFALLDIPDAKDVAPRCRCFFPHAFSGKDLPNGVRSPGSGWTLASPVFLVVRKGAPAGFVTHLLETLYEHDSELQLLPKNEVKTENSWHPEAVQFFK
jgi:eukaryotic-like serine/threonine-protein kinase